MKRFLAFAAIGFLGALVGVTIKNRVLPYVGL
jgi:hypothetical protein